MLKVARVPALLTALLWAMLRPVPAMADVLSTNLDLSRSFDTGNGWGLESSQSVAVPFSLAGSADVTDALLALGNFVDEGFPDNTAVEAYILSDAGGAPGAIVSTLLQAGTVPAWTIDTPAGALITFNCTGGCSLAGGQYWLVAAEPDSNTVDFWWETTVTAFGPVAFNNAGGVSGSWDVYPDYGSGGFVIDGTAATAADVPEPGTLLLLGPGILSLIAAARRRAAR